MSHRTFLDLFFRSSLSLIMATLDEAPGSDEGKRNLELSASVASTGSTLRSASPADTKTPKVRFESLPLPPSQATQVMTPKKPTLAQIFNFDTDGPRQRHKFGFNFTPPPPEKPASAASAASESDESDEEAELKVFTGDEKAEKRVGEELSRMSEDESDEGDELMSSAASVDSLGPSSPKEDTVAFVTKADTPPRLYVSVPSRGVTPTMAPPSNLKPPPLQGKHGTLKIEHHLEVRTPSKIKVTLQSPEASEPASVPSSDVHQPTAKLAALQERLTIAQIKKVSWPRSES